MPQFVSEYGGIARNRESPSLVRITPTIGWVARAIAQGAADVFEVSSVGPQVDYSAVSVEVERNHLNLMWLGRDRGRRNRGLLTASRQRDCNGQNSRNSECDTLS